MRQKEPKAMTITHQQKKNQRSGCGKKENFKYLVGNLHGVLVLGELDESLLATIGAKTHRRYTQQSKR